METATTPLNKKLESYLEESYRTGCTKSVKNRKLNELLIRKFST